MHLELNQKTGRLKYAGQPTGEAGFTLVEALMSLLIVLLVFGTIINGYLVGATKAQWSGYSLAAQSMSQQSVEQARSATWDLALGNIQVTNMTLMNKTYTPGTNSLTWTMTGYTTNILDIPWKGTNYALATNYITIQQLYEGNATIPPVLLQMIRVDTVWSFTGWGKFALKYYTNSTCSYIAPDNRDPSTLGISE